VLYRFFALLGLMGLLALPVASTAADAPKTPAVKVAPTLVVRVHSIDSLLKDANYLIDLAGNDEQARQFADFVKSLIGKKGLEGIDTKKPSGVYASAGAEGEDSGVVVLVPVADEKAVLSLLERLDSKATDEGEGVYKFKPKDSPFPVFFRFANGYLCASTAKPPISKDRLANPADVLPADEKAAILATVKLAKIPAAVKKIAVTQFEVKLAEEDKKPEETDAQYAFKKALLAKFVQLAKSLVDDGDELTVRLDIDQKSSEVVTEVGLTAKPKSKLADDIAAIGTSKSLLAGALGSDAAMGFVAHTTLSADILKALGPVWDEGFAKALEQEKDPKKKAQGEKFMDVLTPTVKSGDLDIAVALRGPGKGGKYAMLMGIKVKDGFKIDETVRKLVDDFSKPEEKARIKFDVEKVGSARIHQLDVSKLLPPKGAALMGDDPFYIGVRDDALLLVLGEGGLDALKDALKAAPQASPPLELTLALKRLAPALSLEEQTKEASKIAAKAFGTSEGSDRVRIAVEGGKSLKARFVIKGDVVKFVAGLAKPPEEK
jgi:hypothetical protein